MTDYEFGDVVLVPFPFTDQTGFARQLIRGEPVLRDAAQEDGRLLSTNGCLVVSKEDFRSA